MRRNTLQNSKVITDLCEDSCHCSGSKNQLEYYLKSEDHYHGCFEQCNVQVWQHDLSASLKHEEQVPVLVEVVHAIEVLLLFFDFSYGCSPGISTRHCYLLDIGRCLFVACEANHLKTSFLIY